MLPMKRLTEMSRPSSSQSSHGRCAERLQLAVSTHQYLAFVDTSGCFELVSAGAGHYYGTSTLAALGWQRSPLLIVGSQRIMAASVRNTTGLPDSDALLMIDPGAGGAVGAWSLPTTYLHDSIIDEGSTGRGLLLAADSRTGVVFQLQLSGSAGDMRLRTIRRFPAVMPALALSAHINGVTLGSGHIWVLHNNLQRASEVQILARETGRELARLRLSGPTCHGLTFWRGSLIYLLSAVGGLGILTPAARGGGGAEQRQLWAAGSTYFTKGLAIVDDVAYFGLTTKQARFDRNWADAELAAFDLERSRLLWRRALPYPGLVNAISAPRLGASCSWRACNSTATDALGSDAAANQADRQHGPAQPLDLPSWRAASATQPTFMQSIRTKVW